MEAKIQLTHPAGKKAIRMDKSKYETIKKSLLNYLRTQGESTNAEILQGITEDFAKNQITFEGSIGWHMEWVKLDLEARGEVRRIGERSPVKFAAA